MMPSQIQMAANTENTPKTLIKRFHVLQEERVQTYNLFEEGFVAYLKGSPNYNFPMYQKLVHEVTQTFQGISQEIIGIEQSFQDYHQMSQIAFLINKIQQEEKKKLESTAKVQIVRQNMLDNPEVDYQDELADYIQRISDCIEAIRDHIEDLKYESEDLYVGDEET